MPSMPKSHRKNLTSYEYQSYSHTQKWVLQILKIYLESESKDRGTVQVMSHLRYAIFCLIIWLCFDEAIEEDHVKKIEEVHILKIMFVKTKEACKKILKKIQSHAELLEDNKYSEPIFSTQTKAC